MRLPRNIIALGVVTINLPRLALISKTKAEFIENLKKLASEAININNVKRHIIQKRIKQNNLPLYNLGFMSLKRQYSTVGIVGIYEALKNLGYDIMTGEGQRLVVEILDTINALNDDATLRYKYPHNVEQVPAENSAIKLAQKDRLLGYNNEFDFYSNQFIPLIARADMLDRIRLQGMFDSKMSGGAICHLNIEQQISDSKIMEEIIDVSAHFGVIYFAINYNIQRCEKGHMSVGKKDTCDCGAKITDNFTRVVGFLTNTKNWHQVRREKDYPNRVFYKEEK